MKLQKNGGCFIERERERERECVCVHNPTQPHKRMENVSQDPLKFIEGSIIFHAPGILKNYSTETPHIHLINLPPPILVQ